MVILKYKKKFFKWKKESLDGLTGACTLANLVRFQSSQRLLNVLTTTGPRKLFALFTLDTTAHLLFSS